MVGFDFENAWWTVPWVSMLWKGGSWGKEGLVAAPAAKTIMRVFLTPVEVWSVKIEGSES